MIDLQKTEKSKQITIDEKIKYFLTNQGLL